MKLRFSLISLLLVVILLFRYFDASRPKLGGSWIQYYNNQPVTLVAQVLSPPEESFTYQKLTVGNVVVEVGENEGEKQVPVRGKILVKTRRYPEFSYGTWLKLQGRLREPPVFEDFSYKEYLSIDGVYSLMNYPEVEILVSAEFNSFQESSKTSDTPPSVERDGSLMAENSPSPSLYPRSATAINSKSLNSSHSGPADVDRRGVSSVSTGDGPRTENFVASASQIALQLFTYKDQVKITLFSKIYQFRKQVEDLLTTLLPEPQASLMVGIVFGIKKAYPPEVYEALRQAGVLHVIVASGFNISVVVGALMVLKGLFGPRLGSAFILLGILAYAVLAGLAPPVVRAAILGAVAVVAGLSGRQQHTLWWLFLTAYLMLVINPLWIKSLSFQLSFLASTAVLVVKPALEPCFKKMLTLRRPWLIYPILERVPNQIRDDFLTTTSVLVLTTPLIWWNFGKISLVALVVNSLVLWTIPLLMFLGLFLVGVGFVSTQLAHLIVYPVWLLLWYFMGMVQIFT